MPRPDSGFLSGVLAGINQFKQTSAFFQQMETSDLQQERLRSANELGRLQAQGYESPADIDARRLQSQRDTEQELYDLGVSRRPAEDERDLNLYEERLRLARQYAPPQRGADKPLIAYKDAMKTLEGYATSEGISIPGGVAGISPGIVDDAIKAIMGGSSGDAIALIKADKYTRLPEAAWLAELPPEFAPHIREYLIGLAEVAGTEDDVLQGLSDLRREFANKGYIEPKTDWIATIQEAVKGKPGTDPIKNINKAVGDLFRGLGFKDAATRAKESQNQPLTRIESRP